MKLASDAMTATWPRRRAVMRGSSGSIVLSTPPMLTSIVLRMIEKSSSEELSLSIEMPALAITRSTGWASSNACSHAARRSRSTTSTVAATTVAPLARHAAATFSSRPASRPVRASAAPGTA